MRISAQGEWLNSSVSSFAGGEDPVWKMRNHALAVALEAIQRGWEGPPFDPFQLAEYLKIKIVPREDVLDARTVPIGSDRFQIEYNPSRPKQRIRFSVAHEIAHTFFPDCSDRIRYRSTSAGSSAAEWELEMLCNLGAAELLMPTGSLPDFKTKRLTIEGLLGLRKEYEVSAESLALRYINVTEQPAAVFVASRNSSPSARYRIDYAISSRSWTIQLRKGFMLPVDSVAWRCTAIGARGKGRENWSGNLESIDIESVGLAPYLNSPYPRILGLLYPPPSRNLLASKIRFLVGDATEFGGSGPQILAHVVNDKTPNWGAGFGRAVREAWPPVQEDFCSWVRKDPSRLRLGNTFFTKISRDITVAPMICQHGYGPSLKPRIRYNALKDCLRQVKNEALAIGAQVHMPRIGSGYAGGSWVLIEQLIDENLCRYGVTVNIYDLPNAKKPSIELFDLGANR